FGTASRVLLRHRVGQCYGCRATWERAEFTPQRVCSRKISLARQISDNDVSECAALKHRLYTELSAMRPCSCWRERRKLRCSHYDGCAAVRTLRLGRGSRCLLFCLPAERPRGGCCFAYRGSNLSFRPSRGSFRHVPTHPRYADDSTEP